MQYHQVYQISSYIHSYIHTSKQSLCIGRMKLEPRVSTSTVLTSPSRPGNVFVTLANGQRFLGVFSLLNRTISPTLTFLTGDCHLVLNCSAGRYSFSHLFQKMSAKYCTFLQRLRLYRSSLTNISWGRCDPDLRSRRWFGVRGSKSLTSSERVVSGRLFTIDSVIHMYVVRLSSSNCCNFRTDINTLRMVLICLSHEPPMG